MLSELHDRVCFLLLLSPRLLCARLYALCNSHLFVWQFWWNLKISRFVMDINSSYRTMAVRATRVKTNVAFMWRGCYVLKQAGWPGGVRFIQRGNDNICTVPVSSSRSEPGATTTLHWQTVLRLRGNNRPQGLQVPWRNIGWLNIQETFKSILMWPFMLH